MTANDYLVGIHWHDVIVIGAGLNGLVAALLLEKRGLKVLVVEESEAIGGRARTEHPFVQAPELPVSTGAALVGVAPPALLEALGLDAVGLGATPQLVVPTTAGRCLVVGADDGGESYTRFFSEKDWAARVAMREELAAMRDDLAKAWLAEPCSLEETARSHVRADLRAPFVALCRGSIGDYLERFGFASERAKALEALEALAGVNGTWDTPGTGAALLTRLGASASAPTFARMLTDEAARRGLQLLTEKAVASIVVDAGVARGVVLKDGAVHHATAIVSSVDPFHTRELAGRASFTDEYNATLDRCGSDGATLKVCLALDALPRLACAPDALAREGFAPTIRLLPDGDALRSMKASFDAVKSGKLPDDPAVEWTIGASVDGHHAGALCIQAPYELAGASWDTEAERQLQRLLAICDRYAPGTGAHVVESVVLRPGPRGHVHPVDDTLAFGERPPHVTPIRGLYSCSAGTHPAAGVLGAAGHGAAMRVARDMAAK